MVIPDLRVRHVALHVSWMSSGFLVRILVGGQLLHLSQYHPRQQSFAFEIKIEGFWAYKYDEQLKISPQDPKPVTATVPIHVLLHVALE